jgi:molecular chaperone HtpG
MNTGKINVQTENIFPIIKKFLYTDHEIFLRELISNAVDATQKLKALSDIGKYKDELGDLTIEVSVDKKNKTITIKDKGIGMTKEEVEKYITEIAFSGAEEFVKKFKNKADVNIIGHFGLGFYSAFMVADKVEIFTKSYKKTAKGVHWVCEGSPEYTIEDYNKKDRGTEIVLHIAEDSKEFLDEERIEQLLNKYCKFMPIPIQFGETETEIEKDGKKEKKKVPRIINNTTPAWTKNPTDLKDKDYIDFYRELYPYTLEEPLFWIHLNVDYPFRLTGILYFPKIQSNLEIRKDKIQLYSNQVFVTDNVEGIVPEFLTLLHGVIDSPDIPLNVSRSGLQSDANVKKISGYITKKVADKLTEIFKNNRKDFEEKWDNIKLFIEYGMLTDDKFFEKAEKFALYKNIDNQYFTLDEFVEKIKKNQTNKHQKTVILYTHNPEEHYTEIQHAKEKGYDVLILDTVLTSHLITKLEQKHSDLIFSRIDANSLDKLIEKDEKPVSKLSEKEKEQLKQIFESIADKEKFTVQLEDLSETAIPVSITEPEFLRRMREQSMLGNQPFGAGGMELYNLIVNTNHPLMTKIINEKDSEKQKEIAKQSLDLAMLSKNLLKGEALSNFINRSIKLINE